MMYDDSDEQRPSLNKSENVKVVKHIRKQGV